MPLVSIVVPVYNVEQYLHRCIDSILKQTLQDFELILIDDGSTDKSGKICDCYAKSDKRVQVLHKENGGQSSARNKGLELCKGEFIYFCDSDDWVEPKLLEKAVEKLEAANADMVRFQCMTHFFDKTVKSDFQFSETNCIECFDEKAKILVVCDELLTYKIGWELCLGLYRAKSIYQNNIRFPNGIDVAEDLFFNILYVFYSRRITFLESALYHYCMRVGSTTDSVKGTIRLNESNELMYKLYSTVSDEYIRSHLYLIHNRIILNEFSKMSKLNSFEAHQEYKSFIQTVKNKDFFNEQCSMFCKYGKRSNIRSFGIYNGWKRNILSQYIHNMNYIEYRIRIAYCELAFIPVRLIRKVIRMLRSIREES